MTKRNERTRGGRGARSCGTRALNCKLIFWCARLVCLHDQWWWWWWWYGLATAATKLVFIKEVIVGRTGSVHCLTVVTHFLHFLYYSICIVCWFICIFKTDCESRAYFLVSRIKSRERKGFEGVSKINRISSNLETFHLLSCPLISSLPFPKSPSWLKLITSEPQQNPDY